MGLQAARCATVTPASAWAWILRMCSWRAAWAATMQRMRAPCGPPQMTASRSAATTTVARPNRRCRPPRHRGVLARIGGRPTRAVALAGARLSAEAPSLVAHSCRRFNCHSTCDTVRPRAQPVLTRARRADHPLCLRWRTPVLAAAELATAHPCHDTTCTGCAPACPRPPPRLGCSPQVRRRRQRPHLGLMPASVVAAPAAALAAAKHHLQPTRRAPRTHDARPAAPSSHR
jgi:hypothetical protein